jgi:hypothetical protein
MIKDRLTKQLIIDLGKTLVVEFNSKNELVVGIGHKVSESLSLGDRISDEQCMELFYDDLAIAILSCKELFPRWDSYPSMVQEVVLNIVFTHGIRSLPGPFILDIYSEEWLKAANTGREKFKKLIQTDKLNRLMSRLEDVQIEL